VLLEDPDLDPYGPDNPAHAADAGFAEFFTSGLATAIERFRGRSADWRATLAGGIVSHTPDNYPVCDWVLPNAYGIIDSGHGFKLHRSDWTEKELATNIDAMPRVVAYFYNSAQGNSAIQLLTALGVK